MRKRDYLRDKKKWNKSLKKTIKDIKNHRNNICCNFVHEVSKHEIRKLNEYWNIRKRVL